jgi:uncharacterized protein YfdQ (DUF2303 family)
VEELGKTGIPAVIEHTLKLGSVELLGISGDGYDIEVASVPNGRTLQSLKKLIDEYRDAPERKRGTATLSEPASFVELVNRHKDDHTVCFASVTRESPSITAVLDYHTVDGEPRFCEHRAYYPFPLSDEWKAWTGKAKTVFSQKDLVEFIEDRMMDLAMPNLAGERTRQYVDAIGCELATPAQVAQIARDLDIRVEQKFVQQTKTATGETQMLFREEHKDQNGAPIRIPGAFLIAIPIFTGGQQAVLPVRLRYRVVNNEVFWYYELALVDEMFALAIDVEIAHIRAGIERPIYIGSPER